MLANLRHRGDSLPLGGAYDRRHGHGHGRGGQHVRVLGIRVPKKAIVAVLGGMGLLAVMGPDLSFDAFGRRLGLATKCIHTIYPESDENAVLMPPVPAREDDYIPTHIQMCYEWIRRIDQQVDDNAGAQMNLLEHRDICLDWTAPHLAMMEILASTVLQTALPRMRYRHGCPAHREYEEATYGFDWSPFQTIFQEPTMAVDLDLADMSLFEAQCRACLEQYKAKSDAQRIRARSLHHCFAFPEKSVLYPKDVSLSPVTTPTPVDLPSVPQSNGNVAPISTIMRPLKQRLYHSALEWLNVTDSPPDEPNSGTVIYIDPNTHGVNPTVLEDYIKPETTSITVLADPLCVVATLPTGQKCKDYGQDIVDYLQPKFPGLAATGFEGSPGVTFQISGSTAGTFSRAILAKDLLCPPNTYSCLLPPVGKQPPTSSTILDGICPACPGKGEPATKFFDKVGTGDNTEVIQLPDDDIPPITEGTPDHPDPAPIPGTPPGVDLAPQFPDIQENIKGDGYPASGLPPPPTVDSTLLSTEPSTDSYKKVEPELPESVGLASTGDPNEPSPLGTVSNVVPAYTDAEKVPTPEQVDAAVENDEPLDINTPQYHPEGETGPVDPTSTTELATDESTSLLQRPMTDENYEQAAQLRMASTDRIITGNDGYFLFEVPCPAVDDLGSAVMVDDGYALTDNEDTVIISDGRGTVTMQSPVTITTVDVVEGPITDPITQVTEVQEYTTIHDPILDDDINITASGIKTNPDSSIELTDSVGTLAVVPETQQCVLITDGNAKKKNRGKGNKKKTHTLVEGTCVSAGNENIPSSDTGTVVMDDTGSLAVTATKEDFTGFTDTDPEFGNSGAYQEFRVSDMDSQVERVRKDNCMIDIDSFSKAVRAEDFGSDGDWVEFETTNTMKSDTVSWIAVDIKDQTQGGEETCIKVNEVPPGPSSNRQVNAGGDAGFYPRRRATCESDGSGNKYATVDVYLHDGSKKIGQEGGTDITGDIPARCEPSKDYGNKCHFQYIVNCAPPSRRLMEETNMMTPKDVKLRKKDNESRLLFAKNILEKCPELGKERVFDHFKFGGSKQSARRIPVSQMKKGMTAAMQ